ncbi:MAG: SpoIIIAH-like family protein [Bacilli bacterium]|nr:SpoIIIAH-like family protein [Bacilli bacterium]
MINKQSLWFVTLFSLIIILGIYYFSSDQTTLSVGKIKNSESVISSKTDDNNISVLKVTDDEATVSRIDELQSILLDSEATLEEKNNAYDELEGISNRKAKENKLTEIIKKEYKYDNFVKITDNQISVVISSSEHNSEIANKIIKTIQEKFKENVYVTVKFSNK